MRENPRECDRLNHFFLELLMARGRDISDTRAINELNDLDLEFYRTGGEISPIRAILNKRKLDSVFPVTSALYLYQQMFVVVGHRM